MAKRKRKKRINFEVSDDQWHDIHSIAKELNITIKKYILTFLIPDIEKRKSVKGE